MKPERQLPRCPFPEECEYPPWSVRCKVNYDPGEKWVKARKELEKAWKEYEG